MSVRPLPTVHGVGMTSDQPLNEMDCLGFRYELVGRYHNYYATQEGWQWPFSSWHNASYKIDGFSPNLNKELHVGHLRNLAVAKSLSVFLEKQSFGEVEFVSLLGASLGVKKKSLDGLEYWFDFVEYTPCRYYDVLMPTDVIKVRKPTREEIDNAVIEAGNGLLPDVWDGPKGPVIVARGDGRPLYAYYDLVFAQEVGPTHYITGVEQKEHFEALGLGDKHLPLGLVLNCDGKKMKSREGEAVSAINAIEEVEKHLDKTDQPRKLAWNVLAWNFLQCKRTQNVKFDVENWTKSEAPGMYITYTYARTFSALRKTTHSGNDREGCENWLSSEFGLRYKSEPVDVELAAFASQYDYWHNQAVQKLDPSPIAHFAHDLARKMGNAYHKDDIVNGRVSFCLALQYANETLRLAMKNLGMFPLETV